MLQFLKLAVQDRIRLTLFGDGYPLPFDMGKAAVALTEPSGAPIPPYQAPIFIAIHGGKRENVGNPDFYGLAENFEFNITISFKKAYVGRFRIGSELITNSEDGVEWLTEFVIGSLHGHLALATEANALIALANYTSRGAFLAGEMPRFVAADDCIERDGVWWGASRNSKHSDSPEGVSQRLTFTGIKMVRYIADIAPAT